MHPSCQNRIYVKQSPCRSDAGKGGDGSVRGGGGRMNIGKTAVEVVSEEDTNKGGKI